MDVSTTRRRLYECDQLTASYRFQEQQFAKRSLLFIGGQVVYRCLRTDGWREDVFFEDQDGKFGGVPRMDQDRDDIGQFEGLIQSYSGLSLSKPTDIYHAFAGLMRYFRSMKVNLFHGIPNAYFDWFLLWIPMNLQTRRNIAPSWSWSGWSGQSWLNMWDWYNRSVKKIRKALRSRTWIIWYQRKAHNSEECLRVWSPKKRISPQSSPRNFYGSHVRTRFSIDCTQTLPTRRILHGAPEYIEDTYNPYRGSGFLQFWTVSVKFKLDKPTSIPDTQGPRNMHSRVGIFGRNVCELGIVFVNPGWAEVNIGKNHEFILLCEGRHVRAKYGKIDDENGWKYKMMLIEWRGDWAERVSIGSIEKRHLDHALEGPVWKEIILG